MKLLIDIGNTRIKPALSEGGALAPIAHDAPRWRETLRAALATIRRVDEVWIADVARAAVGDAVRAACRDAFPQARIESPRSPAAACGVVNAYAEPERLGIDRFLALVASHARAPGPKIVASLGTALTVDALHADGRHRGGLIAPSPALMLDSLLGATGKIENRRDGAVADFGASTEDGLASGCWMACAALVEHAARAFETECGHAPLVLVSGGGGARLARLLECPVEHAPDLVLAGRAIFSAARA